MTNYCQLRNLLPMVEEQKYPDFAARLNGLISTSDISITQLSEKTGVTYEMVRRYTLGTAKPRTPTMRKLSAVLGVDAAYLEYGVGKPSEGEAMKPIASNPLPDVYRVEVLDLTVSAGPGSYMLSDMVEVLSAIEFTSEHARVLFGSRQEKDIKVMTVDGDSMYPTIKSGDRLFFDVSIREFKTDGVYAFVFGKTFHVKRLQMQGLELAVLSDNPMLEKWYIREDNQDQFYVMGKALLQESIQYSKL